MGWQEQQRQPSGVAVECGQEHADSEPAGTRDRTPGTIPRGFWTDSGCLAWTGRPTSLRTEIAGLGKEFASTLTLTPIRARRGQRVTVLEAIADKYQRTRTRLARPGTAPANRQCPAKRSVQRSPQPRTDCSLASCCGYPVLSTSSPWPVQAGLEHNKPTHNHNHKDLKDLFYAEVEACDGIPASEIKLRGEITARKSQDRAPAGGTRWLARGE